MNIATSLSRFLHYGHQYGWSTAWGYIIMPFLKKRKALPAKHQAVKEYLWKWSRKLKPDNVAPKPLKADVDCPVWVCWLQGEDQMPETIRICYNSVIRNANGRNVVLLTFDNIHDYVEIPHAIEQKRLSGNISLTHYADYLRILLLATYGGLWIDASIYVSNRIDFKPEVDELYTVKFIDNNSPFVSQCRWTVGLFGCTQGNILFMKLESLMRRYISEHKEFIDFFLFDYMIAMLYDHDDAIKSMIDHIVTNNNEFYGLEQIANTPYDPDNWITMTQRQTFHRLSWKSNYIAEFKGKPTYYGHLLESIK